MLAPFAVTTHLKDMAVRRTERGFELSEVPLGTGNPAARSLRWSLCAGHGPDVRLVPRDDHARSAAGPVPSDRYWVAFDARRPTARVAAFRAHVLAAGASLGRCRHITGLDPEAHDRRRRRQRAPLASTTRDASEAQSRLKMPAPDQRPRPVPTRRTTARSSPAAREGSDA